MRCPKCGHEFKSPVAVAGGRVGGRARVAKGFAISGQPSAAARKRGWRTRKASTEEARADFRAGKHSQALEDSLVKIPVGAKPLDGPHTEPAGENDLR